MIRPALEFTPTASIGLRVIAVNSEGQRMAAITSEDEARLDAVPTALDRVKLAGELMDRYRQALADLAAVRGDGIVEMRLIGRMSDEEIATELGISRQQVFKLGKEALERLFPDDEVTTMRQADKVIHLSLSDVYKGSGRFSDWLYRNVSTTDPPSMEAEPRKDST